MYVCTALEISEPRHRDYLFRMFVKKEERVFVYKKSLCNKCGAYSEISSPPLVEEEVPFLKWSWNGTIYWTGRAWIYFVQCLRLAVSKGSNIVDGETSRS
jgi:hypothetical protein